MPTRVNWRLATVLDAFKRMLTGWVEESLRQKYALKRGEFTPAMIEAITKMPINPEEAWFVVDAPLNAMSHAPVTCPCLRYHLQC